MKVLDVTESGSDCVLHVSEVVYLSNKIVVMPGNGDDKNDSEYSYVKVVQAGEHTSVTWMARKPNAPKYKKTSGDTYYNTETGEEKKVKHVNKKKSKQAVARSMNKLKNIIHANCVDNSRLLYVSLTYNQCMTDAKRLSKDIEKFIKKLKYWYRNNHSDKEIETIIKIELQNRGAWHAHIIFIFPIQAPEITYEFIQKLWGNGTCDVQAVYDINGLANYFCKFGKSDSYPSNMRIFRTSRGLIIPKGITMTAAEFKQKGLDLGEKTYEKSSEIKSVDTDTGEVLPATLNAYKHECYVKKQKDSSK